MRISNQEAAIHEVGHAVTAMMLGCRVIGVTICGGEDNKGSCYFQGGTFGYLPKPDAATVIHGGLAAHRIRWPRRDAVGVYLSTFRGDREQLDELGIPYEMHRPADLRARAMLRSKWDVVEGLAAILEREHYLCDNILSDAWRELGVWGKAV